MHGSSRFPGVQLQSSAGALGERLAERRAGGEPKHPRRLGGELSVGIAGQVQPGGDATTGKVQLRSRPLALPKPGDFPLPDPRVMKHEDTRDETMAVAR